MAARAAPAHLAAFATLHHIASMSRLANPILRIASLVLGAVLLILSPLIGAIPGPGGVFVFVAGLVLILRASPWARRRFVRLKRARPKLGDWLDRGLRRRSARRRRARARMAR